jgi:hypothetical protein
VEDDTALRISHGARDALRHQEDARQVRFDDRAPVFLAHVEKRSLVVDPRVVHEHVDPLPPLERGREDTVDILRAGDIAGHDPGRVAQDRRLLQRFPCPPHAQDVGALGGEALGDRTPDPAPGAGDDDGLAVEALHPFTAPAVRPRMKNR